MIEWSKKKPIIAQSGKVYDEIKYLLYPHSILGMRYNLLSDFRAQVLGRAVYTGRFKK